VTTTRKKYTEHTARQTRRATPLLERASAQIRQLSRMIPDRQPDAEKQTPETEWRRQRDLTQAMALMRDVLVDVIKDLEKYGIEEEDLEQLIQLEEDVDTNPCRDPTNLVEWLKCWQKWWIYVKECCEENRGYWRQFFYTFHWVGNRLDELQHYSQQKFNDIGDFIDGQQPPPALPGENPTVRVFYQTPEPSAKQEGDVWIQEM
jgi:hypothetical protein